MTKEDYEVCWENCNNCVYYRGGNGEENCINNKCWRRNKPIMNGKSLIIKNPSKPA